jgi:hypothetical protein
MLDVGLRADGVRQRLDQVVGELRDPLVVRFALSVVSPRSTCCRDLIARSHLWVTAEGLRGFGSPSR